MGFEFGDDRDHSEMAAAAERPVDEMLRRSRAERRAFLPGQSELVRWLDWPDPMWVEVVSPCVQGGSQPNVYFVFQGGGHPPESGCTVEDFREATYRARQPIRIERAGEPVGPPNERVSKGGRTEQKEPVGPGLPRPRSAVYAVVDGERDYQDQKWGDLNEDINSISAYALWMEHQLDELRALASTGDERPGTDSAKRMLDIVRKLIALGVACMEQHGAPMRESY